MLDGLKRIINKVGKRMQDLTAETVLASDGKTWLEHQLTVWIDSKERQERLDAERYYLGNHDILTRKRMAIGSTGRLEPIDNVVNNKILDNIYRKMVDQKKNFSFGKPINIDCENQAAVESLKTVMNDSFTKIVGMLGVNVQNGGIAALYPYYDEDGDFSFEIFKGSELMPVWRDSLHNKLLFCVRYYTIEKQKTFSSETIEKVQVFTKEACYNFVRSGGKLIPDSELGDVTYYMTEDRVVDPETNKIEKVAYGWERVPLVFFRFGADELPLLNRCRSLQDAYNEIWSNFKNQMDEDPGQTILILKNVGGEKLGEFRRNLAAYRAIKVTTNVNGVEGGVETLNIEVNADNYELILRLLKKAIVEQCRGFDVKDDSVGGNANKMHISSMYNDCELDANGAEEEFKASLQQLLFFIFAHLANTGKGDFTGEDVSFRFDRDMIMDWQGDIQTLVNAASVYPKEWIFSQTPGVKDPQELLDMADAEAKKAMEEYGLPLPTHNEYNEDNGNEAEPNNKGIEE